MVRRILLRFKCKQCGSVEHQALTSNVRMKAIKDLRKKMISKGQLSLRKARAFLFYGFGLRFDDADLLLKEMVDVGMIRTIGFGQFEIVGEASP